MEYDIGFSPLLIVGRAVRGIIFFHYTAFRRKVGVRYFS